MSSSEALPPDPFNDVENARMTLEAIKITLSNDVETDSVSLEAAKSILKSLVKGPASNLSEASEEALGLIDSPLFYDEAAHLNFYWPLLNPEHTQNVWERAHKNPWTPPDEKGVTTFDFSKASPFYQTPIPYQYIRELYSRKQANITDLDEISSTLTFLDDLGHWTEAMKEQRLALKTAVYLGHRVMSVVRLFDATKDTDKYFKWRTGNDCRFANGRDNLDKVPLTDIWFSEDHDMIIGCDPESRNLLSEFKIHKGFID
jgi:hypothetical protein